MAPASGVGAFAPVDATLILSEDPILAGAHGVGLTQGIQSANCRLPQACR